MEPYTGVVFRRILKHNLLLKDSLIFLQDITHRAPGHSRLRSSTEFGSLWIIRRVGNDSDFVKLTACRKLTIPS